MQEIELVVNHGLLAYCTLPKIAGPILLWIWKFYIVYIGSASVQKKLVDFRWNFEGHTKRHRKQILLNKYLSKTRSFNEMSLCHINWCILTSSFVKLFILADITFIVFFRKWSSWFFSTVYIQTWFISYSCQLGVVSIWNKIVDEIFVIMSAFICVFNQLLRGLQPTKINLADRLSKIKTIMVKIYL